MTGSTVYVVSGNCLDYYCGCGESRGHVIGVASTLESAERLQAEAKKDCWDVTVKTVEFDVVIVAAERREEP